MLSPCMITAPRTVPLSPRQKQVLCLYARSCSDDQIAATLKISRHTVDSHFRRTFEKLKVHTRVEALVVALVRRELFLEELVN
jgi:DNA-binding CsgD family transcriptional regulator